MIKKLSERLLSVFLAVILTLTSTFFVTIAKSVPNQKVKRSIVKELVDKRTENQKVYLNSDGTYTANIYSAPVNYKKGDQYYEIDNSLVKSTDVNEGKDVIYKNKANSFSTYFNEDLSSEQPVKLQFENYNIGLKPVTGQSKDSVNSKAKLIGEKAADKDCQIKKDAETTYKAIQYDNVYNDKTSLQYMATSTGIKENIILNSYNGINKYNFNLTLSGLVPEAKENGNIILKDKTTKQIKGSIPRSYMYDSAKHAHESDSIKMSIIDNGNDNYTLTLTADDQFLKSKSVVYPITIDPSVSISDNAYGNDAYIESRYPNQNYSNNNTRTIRVGHWSPGDGSDCGVMRSFIKFPSLPNIEGGIVVSADLILHLSSEHSHMPVSAYMSKDCWDSSTATWNNTAGNGCYSNHDTTNISGTGYYDWNVTDMASYWYGDSSTNNGIELIDPNEGSTTNDFMAFDAWNSSYPPQLSVTYSAAATNITCSPHGNGVNSGTGFVNLSWNAVPGAAKYYVYVFDGLNYECFDAGSDTSWTTHNKGIWATPSEIQGTNRYQLHHDGKGSELPNDPVDAYIKAGGTDQDSHIYWFRVCPVNSYGQKASLYSCNRVSPALPDTTAPECVQNPQLKFNSIPHNSGSGYTATVTWSAAEDLPTKLQSGIDHYNITLYDTSLGTSMYNTSSNTSCSFSNVKDGHMYYATIYAYDKQGNYSSSQTGHEYTADRTGPTAPSTFTIANNGYSNGNSANISWTGISDPSGISVVQYKITHDNITDREWTSTGSQSTDAQNVQISLTGTDGSALADGDYKIWIRGVDTVLDSNGTANCGDAACVTLHEDTSMPAAVINSPAMQQGVNGFVNIKGNVSDKNLSKWTLDYGQGVDPSLYTNISSGTTNLPDNSVLGLWNTLSLSNGIYVIKLTATDLAGNTTVYKVQVNKTMTKTVEPKLSIDLPLNNAVITNPDKVKVALHRTDGGSISDLSMALFVNKLQLPSMQVSPNQGDLFIDPLQYAEGSANSFYVKGWDGSGNNYYSVVSYIGDNAPYVGKDLTSGSFNDTNKLENFRNVSLNGTDIVLNSGVTSGSFETKTVSITNDTPATGIAINASSILPANSYLTYDISSDGGATWQNNVMVNQVAYFNTPGKDIKIRANFGTTQALSDQPKITMLNAGIIIVDNEEDIYPQIADSHNLMDFLKSIQLDFDGSSGPDSATSLPNQFSTSSKRKYIMSDDSHIEAIKTIIHLPSRPKHYQNGYEITNPISVDNLDHIILRCKENKPVSGEITYYISTDGGTTWNNILLDTPVKVDKSIKSIKLKVVLFTDDPYYTPSISELHLQIIRNIDSQNTETLADSLYKFTVKLIDEPKNVSAMPNINYTTLLRWTSSSTNGVYYNIYRGTEPNFTPSASNRIASNITDTYWNDFNITQKSVKFYYKITAVKSFNGQLRESVPSVVCFANSISGDELNKRLGLENQWGFSNFRTGDGQGYINLSTGNLCYQVTDFVYPGPVLAEVMKRSYNSQAKTKTPLGYGWDFSFNTNLLKEYDVNGNEIGLILKDGDGSVHIFTTNSDGTYKSPNGLDMKLEFDNSKGQYVITRKDNVKYYFDNNLRLQQFKEPNGNTLTIAYDSRGNIHTVANSVGNEVTLSYDNDDKIKTITDPAGRTYNYSYDAGSGRLQNVTIYTENNIPHTDQYIYDSSFTNMTAVKDAKGNITNIQYLNEKVSKVTDPVQRYFSFDYSQPYTTVITTNTGHSTFIYNDDGCITGKTDELGHTINYEYDNNCNVTRMYYKNIVNGSEETIAYNYTYDANNNILTESGPLNSLTTYSGYNKFNKPGEVDKYINSDHTKIAKTTYIYDESNGNLLSSTGPDGKAVRYTYDSMGNRKTMTDNYGNVTSYEYDSFGRLIKTIEPLGKITEVMSYDEQGNASAIKDADGNITKYQYDILGRLHIQTYADSKTVIKNYDMNDNLISSTDRKGLTTTYQYDGDDRQISVTTPENKTTSTQYTYDSNGCLIVTVKDSAGRTSVKYYDKLERVYKEVSGASSNTYQYDNTGNMIKTTDSEGREADAVYNELNQQVKTITDPAGKNIQNTITYDLSGNKLTSTDGEGHTTVNTYDITGRLLTVGVNVSGKNAVTSYSYDNVERDANNNFTDAYNTVTDAMGRVTATYFDALGRKIKDVKKGIPGSNDRPMTTSYQYDLNGNMKTLTEPDQKSSVAYTYDNLNQLKTETYDANNYLTYSYDDNGNKTAIVYKCNESEVTSNYQYDGDNKLLQTIQDGITVNYQYDGSGNITKVSYTDGSTTKNLIYDYDSYNRLQDIKLQNGSNSAEKVRDYAYVSPKGQDVLTNKISTVTNYLQFDTSGSGTEKINYAYNSIGMPGSICYNLNGTDKEKYTLDYDKDGNIKSEIAYTNYDTSKTITKQYTYDEIGELKSVSNNDSSANTTKNTSYTYDLAGNRLSMTQGSDLHEYNYNDFNQLLYEYKNKSSDPNPITTITYDDNGNEKTDISKKDVEGKQKTYTTNYTFNSAGKLIGETVDDGTTTQNIKNSYDGTGNRINEYVTTTKDDGSTTNPQPLETKYFYLGHSLLFTADKDNQKGEENILTPDGQIAASKRFDGEYANNYFFYNYDFRGSVTNILDPSGKLVKGYDYDEFGNTKDSDSTKNNKFKNDVKFTGAIEDQAAGLYYMNSRFYNPTSGRFISQDTYNGNVYEPWTQHLYTYTSNNPVNMIDPTGHIPTHPVVSAEGETEKPRPDPGNVPWYIMLGAGIGTGAIILTGSYTASFVVEGGPIACAKAFSDTCLSWYTKAATSPVVQKIINWGESDEGAGEAVNNTNPIGKNIFDGLKNAKVEFKKNPITGNMEPYLKQFKIDDTYKAVLRRDIGDFAHGDLNHWNLEIQTLKGNMKYDLHMYVDEFSNINNTSEYIPKR